MEELVHCARPTRRRGTSFVFRAFSLAGTGLTNLFGIASVIFLLAVAASIPVVQFLSFGYLLEVTGRLARQQSIRDSMVGLKKASRLGGIVLGTWLSLLPVRVLSMFWFESNLIDPTSQPTKILRIAQIVLIVLVIGHISSAWICGGKLRYFFWPLIAPFSFVVWLSRRMAGLRFFRVILSVLVGWFSPALVDDICNAQPIGDWFLPAIFWKRMRAGNVYVGLRDGVWEFTKGLRLFYYFQLGIKGFVGSFLWLLVPTTLLVVASNAEGGTAVFAGVFGVLFAIPIFAALPNLQAHFAVNGKLGRFLEVRAAFRNYGRAPFAYLFALVLMLVLALPLFFLKIEEIPPELSWTLSLVFVIFSWPARFCLGWAYRRGARRESVSRWWVRYPILMAVLPVALLYAAIFTLTRYTSWNGALSLFENHVFLLPSPFWY